MKLNEIKDKNEVVEKIVSQFYGHTPRKTNMGLDQQPEHLLPHEKFIILDIHNFEEKNHYIWLKILYKGNKIGWICMSATDNLYE